ncbi:MAG: hemerythrin domain-containing protein [Ferruginibacter sp.]
MQRHNIFNQVHKGLRAMLYDTALTIQQTDFTKATEAAVVTRKIEKVLHAFHSHASKEDKFVLPAVEKNDRSLVNEFEAEHETDEILGNQLAELIDKLNSSTDEDTILDTGYEILKAFNSFTAFNLYHMNKEEEKINRNLWDHYTDEDILAIEASIVASIPPADMQLFSTWMIKGINNAEAGKWLSAVQLHAPAPVFNGLTAMAAAELSPERWRIIKEQLTGEAIVV